VFLNGKIIFDHFRFVILSRERSGTLNRYEEMVGQIIDHYQSSSSKFKLQEALINLMTRYKKVISHTPALPPNY